MLKHKKPAWRIVAVYRQWIGKPEQATDGTFYVSADDTSWLHEHVNRLKSQGHKVLRIEKNP